MTLCDTGPLIALIDRDDAHHLRCRKALSLLPPSALVTSWPCFTEAMYLLGRAGGFRAQDELWSWCDEGLLELHTAQDGERQRMRELMRQYADLPMDLADASLIAAAERRESRRIFTLDRHFQAYRLFGKTPLEVVP